MPRSTAGRCRGTGIAIHFPTELEPVMAILRTFPMTAALLALLAASLAACAQTPAAPAPAPAPAPAAASQAAPTAAEHAAHHPADAASAPSSAPAGGHDPMAMMDKHMKAMGEMREKMSRAGAPQERQALMAEHKKVMHEAMGMMGGMGSGGMKGMGAMKSGAEAPADLAARQQMLEKRMDMMQSMMQMMMDRMPAPASK
jgi:hypothetical protein